MAHRTFHSPQLLPLAASLGLAFGFVAPMQVASATTLLVTDCSDGAGSGTLRHTIMAASTNDTVLVPDTCSTITLATGSGEIPTGVYNLTIQGPGEKNLTVDGNSAGGRTDRIFYHFGGGTLTIYGMTLAHAKYTDPQLPAGACIYSTGYVYLKHSTVTECVLKTDASATTYSRGAAIYAAKGVRMFYSTVSKNQVLSVGTGKAAYGVAISAGDSLDVEFSTITGNFASGSFFSAGGGAYVKSGQIYLRASTVSSNYATQGGGLWQAPGAAGAKITYSTISDNTALDDAGALLVGSVDGPKPVVIIESTISGNRASAVRGGITAFALTKVYNSTFAFNRAESGATAAGLYSPETITTYSSIFAGNTGGFDVISGTGTIAGSANLIGSTPNFVPLGTIQSCPRLGPLADNGGVRFTHQLLFDSPAIDKGDIVYPEPLLFDQRGKTRTVGGGTDIGAYERQACETQHTDDRVFLGQFESSCD